MACREARGKGRGRSGGVLGGGGGASLCNDERHRGHRHRQMRPFFLKKTFLKFQYFPPHFLYHFILTDPGKTLNKHFCTLLFQKIHTENGFDPTTFLYRRSCIGVQTGHHPDSSRTCGVKVKTQDTGMRGPAADPRRSKRSEASGEPTGGRRQQQEWDGKGGGRGEKARAGRGPSLDVVKRCVTHSFCNLLCLRLYVI